MTGVATQTVVDLSKVHQEQRLATWRQMVPDLFPGMNLDECPETLRHGSVQHTRLAGSHAWMIDSSPLRVNYCPINSPHVNIDYLSIMLQLQGNTRVGQGERDCRMGPGDLCFLDNLAAFTMEVDDHHSRFLAWQLPRDSVLKHHPHFEHVTAWNFDGSADCSEMITHNILQTLKSSPLLKPHQQIVALNSFIQLLGMMEIPADLITGQGHWRITRALTLIDEDFSDPGFNADHVASEQHISRRQLDRMFQDSVGMTITARIWKQRLDHAANLLGDPQHAGRSITDIALSCGFEDAAHFTRSFKKAHGLTPRGYRVQHRRPQPAATH